MENMISTYERRISRTVVDAPKEIETRILKMGNIEIDYYEESSLCEILKNT